MKQLTNQDRLELITDMITQAKASIARGGSRQILLWGWAIALANFGHFLLESLKFEMPFLIWLIVFPVAIYSVYLGRRLKSMPSASHIDRMYGQVWLAAGIMIFLTLMMMNKIAYFHNPLILSIAGGGMYITGRLLRFQPIVIGSVILWSAAVIESQLALDYHYLISGIAIVLGYIVPGYLLKRCEFE